MAIRILALCAVLLLPLSVCQAVIGVDNGGFEDTEYPWIWSFNNPDGHASTGIAGPLERQDLYGRGPTERLRAYEGSAFMAMVPDGFETGYRPQIGSVYQTGVSVGNGWTFKGVYAFDQVHPGLDYLHMSIVSQDVWDTYIGSHGGKYDGNPYRTLATVWDSGKIDADTCPEGAFSKDWWQPFESTGLARGTYTVVFDVYRNGLGDPYSVAGFDSISHTPEPSLGLLLLVGMIPVAIGFRRRRRS